MRSIILILFFCFLAYLEISSLPDKKYTLPVPIATKTLNVFKLKPLLPARKKEEIDTTELKKTDWYAQITKDIEEKEYAIKPGKHADTYTSPNRKQYLRASYASDKLILQPLTDSVDKWKLALSLRGIYSGKQSIYTPSADPAIEQKEGSIRFHNKDEFTVEYINSPEGVRENFIIQKKPVGNSDQLSVELKANNGWFINKVHDKEIHFAKDHNGVINKKITYNSLKAWDASNKELDTYFSVDENNISIHVNTTDAVYPITIDPLSTTANWVIEGNQANILLGTTAFSAGDVNGDGYSDVIASVWDYFGPNGLPGAAYVYHGSATGLSTTAAWAAYTETSGRIRDVSSAGDVNGDGYSDILVGNETYEPGSIGGIVYIYTGSSTGLSATPDRTLSINRPNSSFGRPVTCAGDVNGDGYSDVLIGAATYSNGQSGEGAAFVFYSGFAPASWKVESDQVNANLGLRINSAGDVNGDGYSDVIIGAYQYDNGQNNEGKTWVYNGSATGLSTMASWTAESNQVSANFGISVSCAGDVNGDGFSDVIVGAQAYDVGPNNVGAAFIYHGSGTGLSLTVNTTLAGTVVNGSFGWVSGAGDVNGDGYSDVLVTAQGANQAYAYYGSATGLPTTANWNITGSGIFGNQGGAAGDVNGDGYSDIVITANTYTNGQANEGAVFGYYGSSDGLAANAGWSNESNQANAQMGWSIASAGDVNADGYSDVIIGALQYTNGQANEGIAFVYYGSATGLSLTASWSNEGNQANALYGSSVASAGDVNGDGYSDIIVGAYNALKAYVYYGSAAGLSLTANWTGTGATSSFYGYSVASAGDVNADGYSDIVIGARNENGNQGAVFAYYGSATGPSLTANWVVGSPPGGQFGHAVASAGDVNGDGYTDVIIGAVSYNNGQTSEGAAFAYYGSANGLSATANWAVESNQANAFLGWSVASAGDVNGDSYADVIIGARDYSNGQSAEGAAFVYYGSATGLSLTANWSSESNIGGVQFGASVASAGDVNGDGYSDVIVGSPAYNIAPNGGRAFVYYGSSTGLPGTASLTIIGNQANSYTANAVASAGDVNGDGYSDVLIGNCMYDNGQNNEGRTLLYYGNNTAGKRNNLRLYNPDLITPMQRSTISLALFGAGLYVKSPLGRQKGKLTWETKKNGQPFSAVPITNSTSFLSEQTSFTDLGISGIELKNQIAKELNARATYIRARVKYDAVTAITGQVYGPWRYPESFLRGNRDMGAIVLPVKFVSFTAIKQNDKALLKWITTEEIPGIQYEVQHSSDGIHFNPVKITDGLNNNHNEYEWLHDNPVAGKNFYRIRAVENGKEVYSVVRQLNFSKKTQVTLYPNPVHSRSQLTLQLTDAPADQIISVEIFTISGQKMSEHVMQAGSNNVTIELPVLLPGQYVLILTSSQTVICSAAFLIAK